MRLPCDLRVGEEALMTWDGNPVPSTQTTCRSSEGKMCGTLLLARCLFFFTNVLNRFNSVVFQHGMVRIAFRRSYFTLIILAVP